MLSSFQQKMKIVLDESDVHKPKELTINVTHSQEAPVIEYVQENLCDSNIIFKNVFHHTVDSLRMTKFGHLMKLPHLL